MFVSLFVAKSPDEMSAECTSPTVYQFTTVFYLEMFKIHEFGPNEKI